MLIIWQWQILPQCLISLSISCVFSDPLLDPVAKVWMTWVTVPDSLLCPRRWCTRQFTRRSCPCCPLHSPRWQSSFFKVAIFLLVLNGEVLLHLPSVPFKPLWPSVGDWYETGDVNEWDILNTWCQPVTDYIKQTITIARIKHCILHGIVFSVF